MKKFSLILIASALLAWSCTSERTCNERTYSLEMMRSEMVRCADGAHLDGMDGKLKWNYTTGLELKSFLDVYDVYGGDDVLSYVDNWYDSIIDGEGNIQTYSKAKYNTDHVCPGRTLFHLYELTGKDKYRMAMDTLRSQLASHPRTSEGGFWHKQTYPWQMWLDGLYMAQPFYAEYTSRFAADDAKDADYCDVINHFLVVAKHTYDPATGLYRHAWDESHEMFWCNPETGQSDHAWGRALGWYAMAIVEILDWVPAGTDGRDELVEIFRGICSKLPEYADPETGMWYQVLDCPGREGNYVEATCSAMFTYAYLKGMRLGLLDKSMKKYVDGLYGKLVKTFIQDNEDGTISLINCCAVAGLGGKDNRRGDYEYYINEKICDNDPKGIGPFIWASLEVERR